jgi:hypothetical protein
MKNNRLIDPSMSLKRFKNSVRLSHRKFTLVAHLYCSFSWQSYADLLVSVTNQLLTRLVVDCCHRFEFIKPILRENRKFKMPVRGFLRPRTDEDCHERCEFYDTQLWISHRRSSSHQIVVPKSINQRKKGFRKVNHTN